MKALLVIQRNGQTLRTQPLSGGEVLVGRGDGCDLRLDDRAVSRQHALLRASEGGLSVERKSPMAPLLLNGSECDAAVLKEGDEIGIGPFVIRLSAAEPVVAAPAPPPPQASDPLSVAVPEELAPLSDNAVESPVLEPSGASEPSQGPPAPAEPSLGLAVSGSVSGVAVPTAQPAEIDVSMISMEPIEVAEDARTRMLGAEAVRLKVRIPAGLANVEEIEFDQDEVSIGRGKGCDVILNDKKASRKHAIIRREGSGASVSFNVIDLKSANGTLVNGARITEHVLTGDDLIRIGDVDIMVQSVSPGFSKKSERFLKVEEPESIHVSPEEDADLFGAAPQAPAEGDFQQAVVGLGESLGTPMAAGTGMSNLSAISGIAGIPTGSAKSAGGGLLEKFKALPPGRQARIGLLAAMGVVFVLTMGEEEAPKAKKKSPQAAASAIPAPGASGQPAAKGAAALPTFAQLKPDLQKFVDAQYNLAMEYYRNRDFDRSLYEVEKIFQYVAEYKDATDLRRYSIEGRQRLQAQEEERKRKEAEKQLKEKVARIVLEIDGHMQRKEYDRAREYFAEVIAIDPENQQVAEWKGEIQKYEDEKREAELRKRLVEETNARALEVIESADLQRREKRWLESIDTYDSAIKLGPEDKKIAERARKGIASARNGLKAAIEPLLADASEAESQGDFARAFQSFEKARELDPGELQAREGMARIRGILTDQLKGLYTEAVLAESYSDFAQARSKFEQILSIAPKDDPYYGRAKRRLAKYIMKEEPKLE
jgi:pSer/pThr/pTyr-binding forkhead associated (FHA) protein/tetratricopeptide (TPR) repeat protein